MLAAPFRYPGPGAASTNAKPVSVPSIASVLMCRPEHFIAGATEPPPSNRLL